MNQFNMKLKEESSKKTLIFNPLLAVALGFLVIK